jgi:RimJ/RimL family protein N-acetyltransferase
MLIVAWLRVPAQAGRWTLRALRDWAFQFTDLVRLEMVVATGNRASHRVAEKVGAIREGVLQRRLLLHGQLHDATMFSLTREIHH